MDQIVRAIALDVVRLHWRMKRHGTAKVFTQLLSAMMARVAHALRRKLADCVRLIDSATLHCQGDAQ